MWRDRKGLLANPLSVAANLAFFYSLFTGVWLRISPLAIDLTKVTLALLCFRTIVRMACVGRVYGVRTALGVPVRAYMQTCSIAAQPWKPCAATLGRALRGRPLKWLKTDHAYPHRDVLLTHKRRLGDLLVAGGHLTRATLDLLLKTRPPGLRLGAHLVNSGHLSMKRFTKCWLPARIAGSPSASRGGSPRRGPGAAGTRHPPLADIAVQGWMTAPYSSPRPKLRRPR